MGHPANHNCRSKRLIVPKEYEAERYAQICINKPRASTVEFSGSATASPSLIRRAVHKSAYASITSFLQLRHCSTLKVVSGKVDCINFMRSCCPAYVCFDLESGFPLFINAKLTSG